MKENESLEALSVQEIEAIFGVIYTDASDAPLTPKQLRASELNSTLTVIYCTCCGKPRYGSECPVKKMTPTPFYTAMF